MTKRRHTPAYSAELRERGVRLFRENRVDYASDSAAYRAIAPKLGCSPARDPDLASDRARQDIIDREKIKEAFDGSGKRYGARKIWHDLRREGHDIARCTVERLMKAMGIQGIVRGQKPITTNPDTSQPCPDDKVNRDFTADMRTNSGSVTLHMSQAGKAWSMSPSSSMSSPARLSDGVSRHP